MMSSSDAFRHAQNIEDEYDRRTDESVSSANGYRDKFTCKLHGYFKPLHEFDECPRCSANFWESEAQMWKEVLFEIRDYVFEQIPDAIILDKIQAKLKEHHID